MEIEILGKKRKVPDFIIAGAMKCGTTSLHHILASHPHIFIPEKEIHFYDMDNYLQHQDFFNYYKNQWYYPDFDKDLKTSFDWYESWFQNAEEKFLGEDSTIYLASRIAHKRIAQFAPKTKIIIMLRNPADRAYSQYCHLVLTGRLTCNFEEAIQKGLHNIMNKSLYQRQIESFFEFLPRDNFYFILFEEFVLNTDLIVKDVLKFLEISKEHFDLSKVEKHRNKSSVPRSIKLQLLLNNFMDAMNTRRYFSMYSTISELEVQNYTLNKQFDRIILKINNIINPRQNRKFPEMKFETRKFLNNYLWKENKNLGNLINKNIDDFWYQE